MATFAVFWGQRPFTLLRVLLHADIETAKKVSPLGRGESSSESSVAGRFFLHPNPPQMKTGMTSSFLVYRGQPSWLNSRLNSAAVRARKQQAKQRRCEGAVRGDLHIS